MKTLKKLTLNEMKVEMTIMDHLDQMSIVGGSNTSTDEYYYLLANGDWTGGWVDNLGYMPSTGSGFDQLSTDEYYALLANGNWGGGHVEGLGYMPSPDQETDISVVFDRSNGNINILMGGVEIASFDAANNVANSSQGIWTNGIFDMMDQNSPHTHSDGGDTYYGSYGTQGIFRANPFYDADDDYRTYMGLHAGRGNNPEAMTNGCIRTTEEAMQYLVNLINFGGGTFTNITVQD